MGDCQACNDRVDDRWSVRTQCLSESALKILQTLNAVALSTAGFGVHHEIGIGELDQPSFIKSRQLENLDQLELAVVEDNPNHRDVVLNGGHQFEAGQVVTAVATADDNGPVGMGDLGAKTAICRPRHRSKAAGLVKILSTRELEIKAEPGKMRAGVC